MTDQDFGESVPRDFINAAAVHLQRADGMLVVGSSLMVYSRFRFVQMAARAGMPIAAVNLGRTRADQMLSLKVEEACESALSCDLFHFTGAMAPSYFHQPGCPRSARGRLNHRKCKC